MSTTTKLMLIETQPLTLTTNKTEPRVDTRLLALQLGGKHKAVIESLTKHKNDFSKLGKVPFQTEALPSGQREKFALLNEDQSFFLLTLSRNNRRIVSLKLKLIVAFSEARKARELHQTEYLPTFHQVRDRVHELAHGSPNERHVHININKLVNKAAGIESGQRATAPLPTQSLIVVAQMMIAQAMQSAHDHHDGYQLAKVAVEPLMALALGTQLQVGANGERS